MVASLAAALLLLVQPLAGLEHGVKVSLVPVSQDWDNSVATDRDGSTYSATDRDGSTTYSGDHGDSGLRGAIHKLDSQFLYLLSKITGLVDPLVASLNSECESSRLKTQSYGAALVAGGVADSAGDYIENMRMPLDPLTMPDVAYAYTYNIGYGLGFGGPYLLPSYLPDCSGFTCSSQDFLAVVKSYSFSEGLAGQHIGEAKLANFGVDARLALGCVVGASGDSKEAAEVEALVGDLVGAGTQRLRLSKLLKYVRGNEDVPAV